MRSSQTSSSGLALAPLIRRTARSICSRKGLSPDDREDFESFLFEFVLGRGRRAFSRFRGEGSLPGFVRVVVNRLLLDYRRRQWGKWCPSAEAVRLGTVAVELERLIERDGYSSGEAVRYLKASLGHVHSERDLCDLADRLPRRPLRRFEGEDSLAVIPATLPASECPDRCLDHQEMQRVRGALARTLAGLEPRDRRLLNQRFVEGLTIAEIARRSGENQRRLYRNLESVLGKLRERMLRQGIDRAAVRSVLERAA